MSITKQSPFRTDLLKGKVGLVTGGATGINFGICVELARHGMNLLLTGRREEMLQKACKELEDRFSIKAIYAQGDVRQYQAAEEAVKKTTEKFGRLDLLVCAAAGNFLSPIEGLSSNAFKTVIEIDLIGTFHFVRASFEELKKSKGSVIAISATLYYNHTPWQSHASAAKAGVDSFVKSIAAEWGEFGIRANAIAPGPIGATEGLSRLSKGIDPKDIEEIVSQTIPLGRLGSVEDIGRAAVFLASEECSGYVTGDVLVVDGGHWLFRHRAIDRETLLQSRKSKL